MYFFGFVSKPMFAGFRNSFSDLI